MLVERFSPERNSLPVSRRLSRTRLWPARALDACLAVEMAALGAGAA